MRPINKLPTHHQIDDELVREFFYDAGFKNQHAIPEYAWEAVKLAYEFGFKRCANLHFV